MTQPSDKKVFPMQLHLRTIFNITVAQINKVSGWVWNTKLTIRIVATLIVLVKLTTTMRVKLRITSTSRALYRFIDTTIKVSRVRTAYTFKMLMRIVQSLVVKYPKLTVTSRALMRLTQTLKVSRVRIACTVILAQFIPLSTHDPYTLSNRDIITLDNMDGTII